MNKFTIQELDLIRNDTPGTMDVIHFNNAGSSLMPLQVLEPMLDYLRLESRLGGYEAVEKHKAEFDAVYHSAARLIGAQSEEIAVVENATRAWDMAFYAIPFQPGDRILTAKASYASNYIAFLQIAKKCGVEIDVIPDDEHGQLSLADLNDMMDSRVRLLAITHIPTNGGLVNPVVEAGRIPRPESSFYLVDACQSVGQMPIDVNEIGCDMLSVTSRKFLRGPRGAGFLYARKERIEELFPSLLDLHAATWTGKDRFEIRSDAKRFENWERNYAAVLGMGRAVEYALSLGLQKIWDRVSFLGANLRQRLSEIPGVIVRDKGLLRCGIVTFTVEGMSADEIKFSFRREGINVSTSTLFSTRLDMEDRGLAEVVRASVHYYNSEAEIDWFCSVLRKMIKEA